MRNLRAWGASCALLAVVVACDSEQMGGPEQPLPADPEVAERAAPEARKSTPSKSRDPDWRRTVVFIYGETLPNQDMFLRGGIDHDRAGELLNRDCTTTNMECALPIRHLNLRNATTAPWKDGDSYLDWYGREPLQQGSSNGTQAEGSALDWTTNYWPPEWGEARTVAVDGYGLDPENRFGMHYWKLDVEMDCSKGFLWQGERWFELKSYITNGPGWEQDVWPRQASTPTGAPYESANHFAQCGKLNVFHRGSSDATILPLGCAQAGLDCGHGSCEDGTGIPVCVCNHGWTGERCDRCAEGYELAPDGSCVPIENCAPGTLPDGQDGCVDDPCLDPNPCTGANTRCVVTLPGHRCDCLEGFVPDPEHAGDCVVQEAEAEGCADPVQLIGDGSLDGTTVGALDDGEGSCGHSSAAGPDRVYFFRAQVRTRYELLMTGYDSLLHVRRGTCSVCSAQIACNDDSEGLSAGMIGIVEPGTYYVFADSYDADAGSFTLHYKLRPDPCADEESACPGVPQCVAAADWSSHQCICPAGTVPFEGGCVDDPCNAPNPCTEAHKTTCTAVLPEGFTCSCNSGYVPDTNGDCVMDPNANEWSFFVFLNGDNNLDSAGDQDVEEMTAAGSDEYVRVLVLQDSAGRNDSNTLYINRGGFEIVNDLGEVDMGDWKTLRDFGLWAVEHYPARHYALVMWNHGSGWSRRASTPPLPFKGFSNDDNGTYAGISIANGDYAKALAPIAEAAGGKLDLVGFDACLMGMYEVAKATAPFARYFVASEETEPGDGWEYDEFLPGLLANHRMSAEELARSIVDAYADSSTGNSTLSVTHLETMDALDASLSEFATQLRTNASRYASIADARNRTQSFDTSDFRDLRHFAQNVAAIADAPRGLKDTANALVSQLQTTVVYNRAQADFPGAYGLAIYLPGRSAGVSSAYTGAGATWSTATTWDEFLQSFAGSRGD